MTSASSLVISPRISEQTYAQSSTGVFVFNVPLDANKQEIKQAVQAQYDVTVTGINTAVIKGKRKASNRRGQRAVLGARKNVKKAYVHLQEGDKISVFEDLE